MTEEQTTAGTDAAASTRKASGRRASTRRTPKWTRPAASRRGPLTVFVHIPKTAGTTLTSVLRGNFPHGGVRAIGNVFHGAGGADRGPVAKLKKSGRVVTRDIYLLGGHLPFGVHQYLPFDTRYITFLRDPVERTLSQYYRLLSVRKRNPVPEGMTFEQLVDGDEYLYDNLQTRMLSSNPEPFGEVTEEMLEEAKENLATKFVCFGLADRFDESLVLLKRGLGLRSILYVTQRVTTNRPRTAESKEELIPIAERLNTFDIELYRWASEQFDEAVAEQDADFAIEVTALRTAVAGGVVAETPPPASELSRERLWEELIRARADLLGWEYELAKSSDPEETPADQEEDLRELLTTANQSILQLHDRLDGLESRLGGSDDDELEPAAEEDGRHSGKERAKTAARLENLHSKIEELETAIGDQPEDAQDVHVVRELERLRALVVEVEEQAERSPQKRAQAEDRGSKAGRRQTPHQKATRIAALTKTRDNRAAVLARSEARLATIREEIRKLEEAGADVEEAPPREDEATAADEPSAAEGANALVPALTPKDRLERLRELVGEKESRIEVAKGRLADVERRLAEITDEVAQMSAPNGEPAAAERVPDQAGRDA